MFSTFAEGDFLAATRVRSGRSAVGAAETEYPSQSPYLGAMDYYEARGSAWAPGFLCSAGSNVDGSTGADSDLMSFYCTTAATTWKDPKLARPRFVPSQSVQCL